MKKILISLISVFAATVLFGCGSSMPESSVSICTWYGNAPGAFVVTYDDGMFRSLMKFNELQSKDGRNIKSTMGLITGNGFIANPVYPTTGGATPNGISNVYDPHYYKEHIDLDGDGTPDDDAKAAIWQSDVGYSYMWKYPIDADWSMYKDLDGNPDTNRPVNFGDYLSIGTWPEFKKLADFGFIDACSHSKDHPHGDDDHLSAAKWDEQFEDSNADILEHMEKAAEVYIYPYYDYTAMYAGEAAKYYIAARTGGDDYNDNNTTDYYGLKSFTVYHTANPSDDYAQTLQWDAAGTPSNTTIEIMKGWIDGTVAGKFTIITGHGLNDPDCEGPQYRNSDPNAYFEWGRGYYVAGDDPTSTTDETTYWSCGVRNLWEPASSVMYDAAYKYLQTKIDAGLIWNDFYSDVVKYLRERQTVKVGTMSSYSDSVITVTISDAPVVNNIICDHPLTLRVVVPSLWGAVSYQQEGGESHETQTVMDGEDSVVFVNAIPGNGKVYITKK